MITKKIERNITHPLKFNKTTNQLLSQKIKNTQTVYTENHPKPHTFLHLGNPPKIERVVLWDALKAKKLLINHSKLHPLSTLRKSSPRNRRCFM